MSSNNDNNKISETVVNNLENIKNMLKEEININNE